MVFSSSHRIKGHRVSEPYQLAGKPSDIFTLPSGVIHQDGQFESHGHEILLRMQKEHFWYHGRHRFLLKSVKRFAMNRFPIDSRPMVVDLGGGCGGWIQYLSRNLIWRDAEMALTDSSLNALTMAKPFVPEGTRLYQTDIMDLQWSNRWDIAFLLDVLEHLPEPEKALSQIYESMKPGGLLFVTVPAMQTLWSFIDEFGHHQKRFVCRDFKALASSSGFRIVDCRYFMFFLSPLVYLTRKSTNTSLDNDEKIDKFVRKLHEVPPVWMNLPLKLVFGAETPLGHHLRFPWGSSLLCVLSK